MKQLPIVQSPVTAFPHEIQTCNIVLNDRVGYEWLYSTYIQWEWNDDALSAYMPENIYSTLPIASVYKIPYALLPRQGQAFVHFVIRSIDKGFYVATYLDESCLSSVRGQVMQHNILIYGYDETKNEAYYMSYDEIDQYHKCVCSLMELAYANWGEERTLSHDNGGILLIQRKRNVFYRVNISHMCGLIEDYLESRPSQIRYDYMHEPGNPNDPYQGMNAYDRVLENVRSKFGSDGMIDVRTFCTIRDHKYVMYERIKYLERNGHVNPHLGLLKQYKKIYQDSERVKLLAMKYAQAGGKDSLDSLVRLISGMREAERPILEKLVEQLHMARELLDKAIITPLGVFDIWISAKYLSYSSVRDFADTPYVTMKDGDSITAWDVVRNDQHVNHLMAYGSVSYLIANVRGKGTISVYFDLTDSEPVSVLRLDQCVGTQIRIADFHYEIPPDAPFLRTDFHFCAQGDENFSFDLYAIRLNYKFREQYADHFEMLAQNALPSDVNGEYVKLIGDGSGKPLEIDFLRRKGIEYGDAYMLPYNNSQEIYLSSDGISTFSHIKYHEDQEMPRIICSLDMKKELALSLPRVATSATEETGNEMTSFTESHGIGHGVVPVAGEPYCVTFVIDGSWVCYRNLYFDRDVSELSVYLSTNADVPPCSMQVFVDRLEGEPIAECQILGTTGPSDFQWRSCSTKITKGFHDVFLKFRNPDRCTKIWLYRFI